MWENVKKYDTLIFCFGDFDAWLSQAENRILMPSFCAFSKISFTLQDVCRTMTKTNYAHGYTSVW